MEGETPALGILVVHAEEVDVFVLSDLLPLAERLVEDGELREGLADNVQDGGLAAADVTFDGDETGLVVFWRHTVNQNL